ncbi:uncharacterized protein [Amphiura filiformis]|uniref:uncharacterized protein n=1 Tax=Amphiura filiformis TaxID=82378 RepID=UPI003B228BEF
MPKGAEVASGEKQLFNFLIALFVISAFEFIIGLATVIVVSLKIRRFCRGETDDDDEADVDQIHVIEPSRSSQPPVILANQMPHGDGLGHDIRYDPYMSPGQRHEHDPRRGRYNEPNVYYNDNAGATYNPGYGGYM